MSKRMAANLLRHGTGANLFHQFTTAEQTTAPVTRRRAAAQRRVTTVEEKMPDDAPSRRNFELDKEREQAVNNDFAFQLALRAKRLQAVIFERAPEQFQVEAERKNPALEFDQVIVGNKISHQFS